MTISATFLQKYKLESRLYRSVMAFCITTCLDLTVYHYANWYLNSSGLLTLKINLAVFCGLVRSVVIFCGSARDYVLFSPVAIECIQCETLLYHGDYALEAVHDLICEVFEWHPDLPELLGCALIVMKLRFYQGRGDLDDL